MKGLIEFLIVVRGAIIFALLVILIYTYCL